MYESFIKECLLTGQSRVYSIIINTYGKKLHDLKPTLFRKWLAKEIDVPEEKINLSSLSSALVRQRKREAKSNGKPPVINNVNAGNNRGLFKFSDPLADEKKKSNTNEM
jgi:molybdopterin converting factor small subunit